MEINLVETLTHFVQAQVVAPFRAVDWTDWRGFWLGQLFNGHDNRLLVIFFLPLVLVLRMFPRCRFRLGVILTSLVFMGYVFGTTFVGYWVVVCAAFYWLSQRYALDLQRRTQLWWNPTYVVLACVAGAYLGFLQLHNVRLPAAWNRWAFGEGSWLLPLGARPLPWETYFPFLRPAAEADPPQLFQALFFAPHVCGLVIFTIRMIHYFAELRRGTIAPAERTFLNFLAFNSFGPTFMQGPIERFRDFQDGVGQAFERRTGRDVAVGLWRITVGLFKGLLYLLYVAPRVDDLISRQGYYRHPEQIESYAVLFFGNHLQALQIYLIFSGYSDIAIGLARLVGYRAAENFRRPWVATSLIDLWRRWHITLSFILRDYVYMPLARRRWNPVATSAVTFLICGALHNMNPDYIRWGLVMGLLVALNQGWSRWMRDLERHPQRRFAAARRACLRLQPLPKLCAWALTINVFALSASIALGGSGGFRVLWELIRRPAAWLAEVGGTLASALS